MKNTLIDKLNTRQAVIGIVGLGYVGLHLALRCLEREYARYSVKKSLPVNGDFVVLCTAHDEYRELDPERLSLPVLDTRGSFADVLGCVYLA